MRADAGARGGFLMEPGIRERVRASVRVLHCVMPLAKALFRARAEASPRVLHPARAAALMDAGAGGEMKIIIFPVNFDKLPGFFDKFLKIYRIGQEMIFHIYSNGYVDNIKQKMNDLSKCIELKSFFAAPHLRATARVSPRGGPARPGRPAPERGGPATPRERAHGSYG